MGSDDEDTYVWDDSDPGSQTPEPPDPRDDWDFEQADLIDDDAEPAVEFETVDDAQIQLGLDDNDSDADSDSDDGPQLQLGLDDDDTDVDGGDTDTAGDDTLLLGLDDPDDEADADDGSPTFDDPWRPSEPVDAVWGDDDALVDIDRPDWVDVDALPDTAVPSEPPVPGAEELDQFAMVLWKRGGDGQPPPASTPELLSTLAEGSADADVQAAALAALELYR